jgi:hypothetical protein
VPLTTAIDNAVARLQDVLTLQEPLGPWSTEPLLHRDSDVFKLLYDDANHTHNEAHIEDPSYIVGRKGAGKTAFLAGAPMHANADVVFIESHEIYSEVERLRRRYESDVGPIFADTLAYAWEVLLFHAAMLGVCRSTHLPRNRLRQTIWSYMTSFGDPGELATDALLASVSAAVSTALRDATPGTPFRIACRNLDLGRGTYESARSATSELLSADDDRRKLYVVVDNLEDLHRRIDNVRDTITALFRVTTRDAMASPTSKLPFGLRFAFPAELLMRLRDLAANPEKDFVDYVIIRWKASELIVLVGNRVRFFLDAQFPGAAPRLGLPKVHNAGDRHAAELTLRAVLPPGQITSGLGIREDPVAYVMRHTQLLPRHLILSLNKILAETFRRTGSFAQVPRATEMDVLKGIRASEHTIVESILTSYAYQYPKLGQALKLLKNRIPSVIAENDLHSQYGRAGVSSSVGLDFDEFLDGALAMGALGIVTEPTERYVRGDFAYTFADDLRPVEDRDELCVHPLFMYRLFDRRTIRDLAANHARPVYPYGSDPEDEEHEV